MEKASTALRRSGVRLRTSLGVSGHGGHGDLQMVIAQLRDAKACSRALAQSEAAAWQDLTKWSLREENRAIQDALCQAGELAAVWTEVQKELGEGLRDFRQHFEMILEGERGLDSARATLEAAEAKELKLKKEMKKAVKRATRSELSELQDRLSASEREKDLAQVEVFDRVREHEVVKMIRVKDGLLKLSQAYVDMAQKCEILFGANHSIAQRIPDVEGRDVQEVKYTGSGSNMRTVLTAKDRIKNFKRLRRSFVDRPPCQEQRPIHPGDLPPPYSENPPENPYYVSRHQSSDSLAVVDGAFSSTLFVQAPVAPVLPASSVAFPRLNQSFPDYDARSAVRLQSNSPSRRRSDHCQQLDTRDTSVRLMGGSMEGNIDELERGLGGLNLKLR